MLELSILGLALACLFALSNWQQGFYLVVVVALLQDPMRKIITGQPPYFILFAGVVFGAAFLGAVKAKVPMNPSTIIGWRRYLRQPFLLFVMIVAVQAIQSLIRFGNPLVPALGLISYLGPFVSLSLAYAFAVSGGIRQIHKFLTFYAICAGVGLFTLYLELEYPGLPILGQVGAGLEFHALGKRLITHSGTFRASEIAAWHAAMCACVVMLLMTYRSINIPRILLALCIIAAIVGLGVLTGRRKFLVMILIFGGTYIGLLNIFHKRGGSNLISLVSLALMAYAMFTFGLEQDNVGASPSGPVDEYQIYLERTSTVFGDVDKRFIELGLAPMMWAYHWFGLFGGGAGIATQGVQMIIPNAGGHLGAAEGGLGKIMVELGLPGLLALAALGWALIRHIWSLLRNVSTEYDSHRRLACALVAILIANLASFSVAAQAFSDIFILLFIGTCLGFLLAIPQILAREVGHPARRTTIARRPRSARFQAFDASP